MQGGARLQERFGTFITITVIFVINTFVAIKMDIIDGKKMIGHEPRLYPELTLYSYGFMFPGFQHLDLYALLKSNLHLKMFNATYVF